jgi:hypothetical protein
MRFSIEQHFDASASDVLRALTCADYLRDGMSELPDLGAVDVRTQTSVGVRLHQVVAYAFTGDLPSLVTAFIDPKRLSWLDTSDIDAEAMHATFAMRPEHYPTFFTANGAWTVTAHGRTNAQRTVRGELKVHSPVPFTAGKIESAIVEGLRERLAVEPSVMLRWLSANPA